MTKEINKMAPLNLLVKWLKKIFLDTHSAIISIIVFGLLTGTGSIYLFYKNLWNFLKTTMLSQPPLWATITLVLVALVYTYLKTEKLNRSPKSTRYKETYFTIGKFKWKTDIFKNNDFYVHPIPYCLEHGTKLVYADTHYACPAIQLGCESMIEKDKLITNHEAVKSLIEYQINKK